MRQNSYCKGSLRDSETWPFHLLKAVFLFFALLSFAPSSLYAQFTNTYYDQDNFIFYYENGGANNPGRAQDAFVINSSGEVLQKWTGGSIIAPEGSPGYLLENGLLLRGIEAVSNSAEIFNTGAYGILQMVDKDGNVVWEYNGCSTNSEPANGIRPFCLHHDVEPMPNGNILASRYVVYTEADAIAEFGFGATGQGKVTMDEIVEIEPDMVNGGGTIVWQWRMADHVVQDVSSTLPSYGVISNSPGRFDINSVGSNNPSKPRNHGDHIHLNGISYNPVRDEILFSSFKANEVFIINHGITTAEAATSSGDFMWRWGNPANYDYGGGEPAVYSSWRWTKGQHDPRWLNDESSNITIHNNNSVSNPKPSGGMFEAWTECFELELPYATTGYVYTAGQPYGPASPTVLAEYNPELPYFNDGFASGAQKLSNGHVFSGSSPKFTLLEQDENGNIVWYFDCRTLTPGGGQFWKPFKYPADYAGFRHLGIAETNRLELSITGVDITNETATLSFIGSGWLVYDVQASTNLENWVAIATNVPGAGTFTNTVVSDSLAVPSVRTRFYRLLEHR